MQEVELKAELREGFGKGPSYRLRQKGFIPAVYYGHGETNLHLSVDERDLLKAVSGVRGINQLMKLTINGKGSFNVLLKAFQAHPIKRNFTHADFIHVDLNQKIHVKVPIKIVGKAAGIKEGGILEHMTRELDVFCFPNKIPNSIDVDVSELAIGQNLHLNDIKLPDGVDPTNKLNVVIAAVIVQKEEEIVAAPVALAEPEVLTAKKVEGEGAGAEGKTEGKVEGKTEGKTEPKKEGKKEGK